jgi:hypothetical protein
LFRRPKLTLSCSAEGKEGRKEGRKEELKNLEEVITYFMVLYWHLRVRN